ncbi:MAG: 6-chlorohydroxyquinol-1,2-dioxygenase [Gammaproteobacteria bacterium]|nr:6-chlorohydroxyquinol-1,2-dioxygenase [Gammaproteobacteria bacterium]
MADPVRELLERVIASYRDAPDPRLREIMQLLSRALFGFIEAARPTQAEWLRAMEFLTAVGKAGTPTHSEHVLLADVLGASTLLELLAQRASGSETAGTVLGPVYRDDSPWREYGASLIDRDDGGGRVAVSGWVRCSAGAPLGGATVDVWGCASNGLYPSQDPVQPASNLRGRFLTAPDGSYAFTTLRPVNYSVPTGGPVGTLLQATARSPGRAAHLHLWVRAAGHRDLITHVFDAASNNLGSDAVFSVAPSLVRAMEPPAGGPARVRFDIVLAPTDCRHAAAGSAAGGAGRERA